MIDDEEIYKIAESVFVREATKIMAGEFIMSDEYTLAKWVLERSKRPGMKCKTCNDTGTIIREHKLYPDGVNLMSHTCPDCGN